MIGHVRSGRESRLRPARPRRQGLGARTRVPGGWHRRHRSCRSRRPSRTMARRRISRRDGLYGKARFNTRAPAGASTRHTARHQRAHELQTAGRRGVVGDRRAEKAYVRVRYATGAITTRCCAAGCNSLRGVYSAKSAHSVIASIPIRRRCWRWSWRQRAVWAGAASTRCCSHAMPARISF